MIKKIIKHRKVILTILAVLLTAYFNLNLKFSYEINKELAKAKKGGQITELSGLEKEFLRRENRAKLYLAAAEIVNIEKCSYNDGMTGIYNENKEEIKKELLNNQMALDIMEKAVTLSASNFNYEFEKGFTGHIPNFLALRQVAQLLAFKAMDDIDCGNYDEAVKRCAQGLSLSKDLASEGGMLINHMISVAIARIALQPLEYMADQGIKADYGPAVREMQFIRDNWNETFAKCLEGERTMAVDAYRRLINNDRVILDGMGIPDENIFFSVFYNLITYDTEGLFKTCIFNKLVMKIAKPYLLADELHYVKNMNRMIKEVRNNPSEEFNYDGIINKYMLSSMLIPNMNKAREHNIKMIEDCDRLIKSFN